MTLHLETLELAARAALAEATGAWREGSVETNNVFALDPDAIGPERVLLQLNQYFPHEHLARYIAMLHPEAVLDLIARMNSAANRLVAEVDRLENEVINATLAVPVGFTAGVDVQKDELVYEVVRGASKVEPSTEALLMRYIDRAKKAAGRERISGEPLSDFITRILEELRALRNEVGS